MSHLPTSRTSVSPLFPSTEDPQPSLYIPRIPPNVFLPEILSQVGHIDSIDWVDWVDPPQAYVHFSMWYDTPLAEKLYAAIMDDDDDNVNDNAASYRLYDTDKKKYVICRRNRHPVPRYRGPSSREYFIAAIDTLETAYTYGRCRPDELKRKHIRFDEDLETEDNVDDYYVDVSPLPVTEDTNKNIHQLAAEYEWWLKTWLQVTDRPQQP